MTSADIGVLFGGLDTIGSGKICKRTRTEMEKDKEKGMKYQTQKNYMNKGYQVMNQALTPFFYIKI
jgi:hypothetical protein